LRDGVLAAWRSSPTRFREDANAESELALLGYADRLLVELAQNAADAAQRAGIPGYLRVSVKGSELRAANTGAPLDAGGVAALAALRASAKRSGDSVGQFGVGFAAVLAVTDAPRVISRSGGVQFCAERTAEVVAGDPALGAELARRGGRPPVLRLVWPVTADPPAGFDTEVQLPLRAGIDPDALLGTWADEAADLLLALPWLHRIDIGDRVLRREGRDVEAPVDIYDGSLLRRWQVVRRTGSLPAAALAGLGPEARGQWSLCWALPVDVEGAPLPLTGEVLHAPTPTAERLTLPARLISTVPVDSSRRHVHPGPAADLVLDCAARAYPQLAAAVAPVRRTALVPSPGFPASQVDATLREGILGALRQVRWLPCAGGGEVSPADAVVLDVPLPELADLLAEVTVGLLDAELAAPAHITALTALGVSRLRPAAIVELLAGLDRPPSWWRRCYAALTPLLDADPAARDELGALPVPLADGRTVTGPRGVLLGEVEGVAAGDLMGQVRLAHPDAAHPLLERLGAHRVGPAELLDALRPAIERSVDDAEDGLDVTGLTQAVLSLAGRLAEPVAARPWLGALALPADDGTPRRADELVLPGGALRDVLAADAPLGVLAATVAAEHDAAALQAVGVLDSFAILEDPDPTGPDHDLDAEEQWWDWVLEAGEPPTRLLAVRDLDLVDEAHWPAALRRIAADPTGLAALRMPGGYTGWWLSRYARFGGHPPAHWRLPGASALEGLYDVVPGTDIDHALLSAAGVRTGLSVAGAADAADLLARLADPDRTVIPAVVHAAHAALAGADIDPADVEPPARVRAVTGEVVDADRAMVLDAPWLAAVLPAGQLVSGGDPDALAELLDLPVASERAAPELLDTGAGRTVRWAELAEVVAVCAAAGLTVPPGTLQLHEQLCVRHDGAQHPVPFWVTPDGTVHATDPVRALCAAWQLHP
jgi:hypothetical protein